MLAARFEQANRDVVAEIEACSDDQLRLRCAAEGWTVAALACHVAEVHAVVAGWVRAVATGEPLPELTMAMIDWHNAEEATCNALVGNAEVLVRLRRNGAEAAALIRTLGDAELDRTAPFSLLGGGPVSAQTLIERILIGDPVQHLPSLRATIAAVPAA
jgi:hypothetical protein